MNDFKFNQHAVWEIIKDDLENLPSRKKIISEFNELLDLYKTVNPEFMATDIEGLSFSISYLKQLSDEIFENELKELVVNFQKNSDKNF